MRIYRGREQERLAALYRYEILDTQQDLAFDRVTSLAARLLKMPVGLISFIDNDRIWFKSRFGANIEQVGREPGLCATCVDDGSPRLVTDTHSDPSTLSNTLVVGEIRARFYLGVPLRSHDGFCLGTLSVMDVTPRTVTHAEVACLVDLAAVVMDELEFRLAARKAELAYREELTRAELREDYISSLSRELAHRSKNLLTVVHAIARQTKSNTNSVKDYVQRLAGRILGLAETHDLISEKEWQGVTLSDLAWRHLDPFLESTARVEITGSSVILTPVAAQNIGLALHELATNAIKFGALSRPDGRVILRWVRLNADAGRLRLCWLEENCPGVDNLHRGFGRLVLERIVPDALEGRAHLSFDTGCLNWVLEVPVDKVLSPSSERDNPTRTV